MQKIFIPENEIELVMVKGLLEAAQIPFHVQNEHFGGLYIGPQIQLFNQRAIMVPPEYVAHSKEIIADYIENQQQPEAEPAPEAEKVSIREKLRLLAEALIFCWIVPRKRRHRSGETSPRNDAEDTGTSADGEGTAPERKGNEES
ncbi:MAG: DUF2007 domain-containing protein [Geobacteraceae bacterium]|nr:DUF2007 domain-containing protein [Geobacteraceae bacterium]